MGRFEIVAYAVLRGAKFKGFSKNIDCWKTLILVFKRKGDQSGYKNQTERSPGL